MAIKSNKDLVEAFVKEIKEEPEEKVLIQKMSLTILVKLAWSKNYLVQ